MKESFIDGEWPFFGFSSESAPGGAVAAFLHLLEFQNMYSVIMMFDCIS